MASPPAAAVRSGMHKTPPVPLTPSTGPRTPVGIRLLQLQLPGSAGGATSDEAMWRRLKEAGFDEEMIKRRDKAALVAYITKLEAELYEYQHHMGVLILERKEWTSKHDEVKAEAELADINHRREIAIKISALAEAQKREENLRKALRVEKECVSNLEKALHEMRAESAETKVAAESRLAEADLLAKDAQRKLDEAESKLRGAESMLAEANLCSGSASRKLQEVEAREDELRRRSNLLNSEWDAKEKDISYLRESVNDTQRALQKEREKLLEQQLSLNSREELVFERSKELDKLENELREIKEKLGKDLVSLTERESSLSVNFKLLSEREQVIFKREAQLDRRERELLVLQESLVNKEKDEVQRLRMENESLLEKFKFDIESQLAAKKKLVEDELEAKKQEMELKEIDFLHRKNVLDEKENELQLQTKTLANKEMDISKKLKLLSDKKELLSVSEKKTANAMLSLEKERNEIMKMKKELEEANNRLEDEKLQVILAHQRLEVTTIERNDLSDLETKLKEEIDSFRIQKAELAAEIDRIRKEKEKFEAEWELIDEKKEELRKEVELVEQEKRSVAQYQKNEHESLKLEKDLLLHQFKRDSELLTREREEFMHNMEREHSDWFVKIQRERDAFLEDIKIQKRELEISIEKRRAEIETYLREKEEAFENEKKHSLQQIDDQKEMVAKELENLKLERERLKKEQEDIAMDREMRGKEWSEMRSYVNELELQREKLQKARELLEIERREISEKIEWMRELEKKSLTEVNAHALDLTGQNVVEKNTNRKGTPYGNTNLNGRTSIDMCLENEISNKASAITPTSSFSWVKKYTNVFFRKSPELHVVSTKHSSPGKTGRADAKFDVIQGRANLNECLDRNKEQISKSADEKVHLTKTILCKKTFSVGDGFAENLNFDERICEENAMYNGSLTQDVNRERSKLTDGDTGFMPPTRKRFKDSSSSTDPCLSSESLKKYQKRRRQDEIAAQSSLEDIICNSSGIDEAPRASVSSPMIGRKSGTEEQGVGFHSREDDASVNPRDLNLIRSSVVEIETEVDRNINRVETGERLGDCVLNTNSSILLSEGNTGCDSHEN